MRTFSKIAAASAAVMALCAATPSQAAVWLGFQNNGGAIVTVDVDASIVFFAGSFGAFEVAAFSGSDGVYPQLGGASGQLQNSAGGDAGTLDVYVTVDNLTEFPGFFDSSFAANVLPAGWTLTTQTYANANNALWGIGGTLLANKTFNGIGTHVELDPALVGPSPYSLTMRYTIRAPTHGAALANIAIGAVTVPEPATWALMLMGFGGAGYMIRRRRGAFA